MDTLVSLGVLAAFGWSLWALLFGHAGLPGMTHAFSLAVSRGDPGGQIYLEVVGGVTTFLLAGRYFEARSKRRAGAALRALLELGAKDVAVLRDGVEGRVPIAQLAVGDRFVVRPGEKVATDGVVVEGVSAIDATTRSDPRRRSSWTTRLVCLASPCIRRRRPSTRPQCHRGGSGCISTAPRATSGSAEGRSTRRP